MAQRLLGLFLVAAAMEDELSLLQLPLPGTDPLDAESQQARLRAATPLAWVHIPKCGSSFGNFLVDLPGICPDIPRSSSVTDTGVNDQLKIFQHTWGLQNPDGACHANIYRWGNHRGVGDATSWDKHYKHKAMIMLRQPEQRLLSAFYYNHHSWPRLLPPLSVRQYGRVIQGCAVRILTRAGNLTEDVCGGRVGGLPTESEVQLAVERLRSDFAFVGLTDQWALSMCLGHRMFGGKCHLSDFVDTRVTRTESRDWVDVRATPDPWDTTSLRGWSDPYDGALYEAAEGVFHDELQRYRASLKSCEPCFEEAGIRVS